LGTALVPDRGDAGFRPTRPDSSLRCRHGLGQLRCHQPCRRDPWILFAELDFSTRELYRHAIEHLARRSPHSEIEIARLTTADADAARQNPPVGASDPCRESDPGYYLIGKGRAGFETRIGYRATFKSGLVRANEPRRDFRRLQFLRRWSHDREHGEEICTGSPRSSGQDGV
jgi:hypothetical protein